MPDLTQDQKRDYQKFFVEEGEAGFSPERNEYIVNKTIEDYEKKRKEKTRKYTESVAERSDAVVSYLRHLSNGKFTSVEKYFGRRELARLRGEKIMQVAKGKFIELVEV